MVGYDPEAELMSDRRAFRAEMTSAKLEIARLQAEVDRLHRDLVFWRNEADERSSEPRPALAESIELAPRDGTEFLGWVYGSEWALCKYHKNDYWKTEGFAAYGWDDGYEVVYPSHWMPLPEPPTT